MLLENEAWEVWQDQQREMRESDPRYIDPRYADECKDCEFYSDDPLMCTKPAGMSC